MIDSEKRRTGVLLVNYRQWTLTEKCIRSLLAGNPEDCVIGLVDNCSGDPPPEWILEDPRILFHLNDSNEGLTAGNNKAYEMVVSRGVDYVFILNNDTEVSPDAVSLLTDFLENNPEAGAASPAVMYASHPDVVWSAGGRYSRIMMKLKQAYPTVSELPEEPVEMDQVSGCAMMMRASDYLRCGMQDPDLFVYYEDTDLCFRIREHGLGVFLVPKARVLHHVSISVGGVYSPFAVYFTHRNRYIVAARHLGFPSSALFKIYYAAVTLWKTAAYPLRGKTELVGSMWLGFLHGILKSPGRRPARLFKENQC